MKMRALLLIAIFIGGMYMMVQSMNERNEKPVHELFTSHDEPFVSLSFSQPSILGKRVDTWTVNEDKEIENLLLFLEGYQAQKIEPEEAILPDSPHHFSISLNNSNGKVITIIIDENIIIEDTFTYYEIVNESLDIEWLVQFFLENKDV